VTDADFRAAICAHAHDGLTIRACGDGIALYVHRPQNPREPRLYEGADLEECIERMAREDSRRAPTLPPPRSELPTMTAVRGKD
jgi:hypothetical protein